MFIRSSRSFKGFITLTTFFIFSFSLSCFGHGDHGHDHMKTGESGLNAYAEIVQSFARLDFKPAKDGAYHPTAFIDTRGPIKRLVLGSLYTPIDGAFTELFERVVDMYLQSLETHCDTCEIPKKEEVIREAKNLIRQGWTSKVSKNIYSGIIERYSTPVVQLAARYGYTAGVLKVIGELAEDAMLIVFKMPGAHVLCELITTAIALYSGPMNSLFRTFSYSPTIGHNPINALVKKIFINMTAARSFSRLKIVFPNYQVKDPEFRDFLNQNPDRSKFVEFTIKSFERAGASGMANSFRAFLDKNHRFLRFAEILDRRLKKEERRIQNSSLSDSEKTKAMESLSASMHLSRAVYEGHRYKRFFWLTSRKGKPNSLGKFSNAGPGTKGRFWFYSLRRTIEPNFSYAEGVNQTLSIGTKISSSPIAEYIAKEFSNDPNAQMRIKALYQAFETILTHPNRRIRSQQAALLESLIRSSLIPNLRKAMNPEIRRLRSSGVISMNEKIGMDHRIGRLFFELDLMMDVLKNSLLMRNQKNSGIHPKHIMTYLIDILNYQKQMVHLGNVTTQAEFTQYRDQLNEFRDNMLSNRFWIEKSAVSAIPTGIKSLFKSFRRIFGGGLRCIDLY